MKKEAAEEFVRLVLECNGVLAHAADVSRQDEATEQSKEIRKCIAHMMMEMFDKLVVPVWESHPDLVPADERPNFEHALKQRGKR